MAKPFRRYRLMLILCVGVLTILACDMSVDFGITCLRQVDSKLYALSTLEYNGVPDGLSSFVSEDGGLTWSSGRVSYSGLSSDLKCRRLLPQQISDPRDPRIQYRIMSGGAFERSADGGQTWQREIESLSLTEAEATYYKRSRDPLQTDNWRQPQDLFIDRVTGNVVVALGQAGVMVRTPDGQWRHVSVGPYFYEALDATKVGTLLSGELLLGLAAPFLIIGTSFLIATGMRWWYILYGLPAWSLWLLAAFLSPASTSAIFSARDIGGLLLGGPMLIAALWSSYAFYQLTLISRRALLVTISGGLAGALLFCLPYVLWAWAKIPAYGTAGTYALLLMVASIIVTAYVLQRELDRAGLNQSHAEPKSIQG